MLCHVFVPCRVTKGRSIMLLSLGARVVGYVSNQRRLLTCVYPVSWLPPPLQPHLRRTTRTGVQHHLGSIPFRWSTATTPPATARLDRTATKMYSGSPHRLEHTASTSARALLTNPTGGGAPAHVSTLTDARERFSMYGTRSRVPQALTDAFLLNSPRREGHIWPAHGRRFLARAKPSKRGSDLKDWTGSPTAQKCHEYSETAWQGFSQGSGWHPSENEVNQLPNYGGWNCNQRATLKLGRPDPQWRSRVRAIGGDPGKMP
jgi:hypothetical protein